jgi:hypothetical protein
LSRSLGGKPWRQRTITWNVLAVATTATATGTGANEARAPAVVSGVPHPVAKEQQ